MPRVPWSGIYPTGTRSAEIVGIYVVLDVHDVRGARVRRLVDGSRPAGGSIETWDGRDDAGRMVRAGIYFVRLAADGVVDGARIVRLP